MVPNRLNRKTEIERVVEDRLLYHFRFLGSNGSEPYALKRKRFTLVLFKKGIGLVRSSFIQEH